MTSRRGFREGGSRRRRGAPRARRGVVDDSPCSSTSHSAASPPPVSRERGSSRTPVAGRSRQVTAPRALRPLILSSLDSPVRPLSFKASPFAGIWSGGMIFVFGPGVLGSPGVWRSPPHGACLPTLSRNPNSRPPWRLQLSPPAPLRFLLSPWWRAFAPHGARLMARACFGRSHEVRPKAAERGRERRTTEETSKTTATATKERSVARAPEVTKPIGRASCAASAKSGTSQRLLVRHQSRRRPGRGVGGKAACAAGGRGMRRARDHLAVVGGFGGFLAGGVAVSGDA